MWKDPVVEEVRAVRDAYAKRFNYDIDAICEDLRRQEKECGHELATHVPGGLRSNEVTNRREHG